VTGVGRVGGRPAAVSHAWGACEIRAAVPVAAMHACDACATAWVVERRAVAPLWGRHPCTQRIRDRAEGHLPGPVCVGRMDDTGWPVRPLAGCTGCMDATDRLVRSLAGCTGRMDATDRRRAGRGG
jgi:hypothetical protein